MVTVRLKTLFNRCIALVIWRAPLINFVMLKYCLPGALMNYPSLWIYRASMVV